LDELKKIRGWGEFTSSTDWDADFTLDSQAAGQQPGQPSGQPGGINLAWASREVIMALPGVSEDRVDQLLALRKGADELDGTEDDWGGAVPTMQQVETMLGSPPGQLAQICVIEPRESVWRVISIGKSREVTRKVRVVFVKQLPPQLKSWKEF